MDVNFIPFDKLEKEMEVTAKIRYSAKPAEAILTTLPNGRVKVSFKEKQRAITKGQSVVFYDNEIVVGGGIIGIYTLKFNNIYVAIGNLKRIKL